MGFNISDFFKSDGDVSQIEILTKEIRAAHPEYADIPDDVLAKAAAKNEPQKYGYLSNYSPDAKVSPDVVPRPLRTDSFYRKYPALATEDAKIDLSEIRKKFPMYADVPDAELAGAAENNDPQYKGLVARYHAQEIENARNEVKDKVMAIAEGAAGRIQQALGLDNSKETGQPGQVQGAVETTLGVPQAERIRKVWNQNVAPLIDKVKSDAIDYWGPTEDEIIKQAEKTGSVPYGKAIKREIFQQTLGMLPATAEDFGIFAALPMATGAVEAGATAGAKLAENTLAKNYPKLANVFTQLLKARTPPAVVTKAGEFLNRPLGKPAEGAAVTPDEIIPPIQGPDGRALPRGQETLSIAPGEARRALPQGPEGPAQLTAPTQGEGFTMASLPDQAAFAERSRYSPKAGEIITREGYKPKGPSQPLQDFEASLSPEDKALLTELRQGVKNQPRTIDLFKDKQTGVYAPDRKALHDAVINDPAYNKPSMLPEPGQPPVARIVIGPPAAGKSTGMENLFGKAAVDNSILIDNDLLKTHLPGWEPRKAELFHHESSDIETELMKHAVKNGYNVTQAILGKNSDKVRAIMQGYKENGYRVELYHTDLPPVKSAGRSMERVRSGGRFVDPAYVIDEVGLKTKHTYDRLKSEADIYGQVSSDVPRHSPPKLIERGTGDSSKLLRLGRSADGRVTEGYGSASRGEASQANAGLPAKTVAQPGFLPETPTASLPPTPLSRQGQIAHEDLLSGFTPDKTVQGDLFGALKQTPLSYKAADNTLMVPVKDIYASPERFQPRRGLIDSRVQSLAEDISQHGYKAEKPITAWQDPKDGKLYVLAGHHRLAAAERAGLSEIPVNIVRGTESDAIALARRSNSTRAAMTAMEEARAFKAEVDSGSNLEQISKNYGGAKTSDIQKKLELNNLSKGMQDLVDQGQFPVGHAVELGKAARTYGLSDTVQQQIFNEIVKKMDVTPSQFKTMMDSLGPSAAKQIDMGFDFKIDQGILTPLREMANKMGTLEKAKRQLSGYVKYIDQATKSGEKLTNAQLSVRNLAERQVAKLEKEILQLGKSVGKAAKTPDMGKLFPKPASAETGAVSLEPIGAVMDLGNGKTAVFKRQIYDRFEPIKYKAGEGIDPAHPGAGGNYTESYVAARTLKGKIRAGGEALLKELNSIVQPLENNADRQILNKIYSLRNFAELDRIGKTTSGVTEPMANKLLADLKAEVGPERFNRISSVADAVADLQNNKALDILVQGKVITPETAAILRERYPHYLRSELLDQKLAADHPEFRSSDNGEPIGRINKSFLKTKQGTKEIINTDVLDVVRRSLVTKVAAAEKQMVVDQIVKQFGEVIGQRTANEAGGVIKSVDPRKIPAGYVESQVKASNGKIYALRSDIEAMLQGLNKHEMDMITNAIGHYNRFFKAGATTYRAPFVLSNLFRDAQELLFKARSVPGQANKAVAYGRALFSSIKDAIGMTDANFAAWQKGGGAYGGVVTSIPNDVRIPYRLLDPKQQMNAFAGKILSLPFKSVEIPASILENTSRMAEYLRLKPTKLPESLKILNSRDITVDFEKMGDAMRVYNTYIPFLNPATQGSINILRAFRDQPAVSTAKLAGYIAVPTVGLYAYNRSFKNDDVIDPYIKDNFWYINTGNETEKDGQKVPVLLTVRKGETAQLFSNPIQAMLEYATKDKNVATRLADWGPAGIARTVASFTLPPLLKEPIEQISNYDTFRQGPIIPQRLENVQTGYQFTRGTSNIARAAGEKFNVSPLRLEHALSGIWPASKQVTELADLIFKTQPEFPRQKRDILESSRAFQPIVRTPSGFFSQDEAAARRFDAEYKESRRTPAFLFKEGLNRYYKTKSPEDYSVMRKYAAKIDTETRKRIITDFRKQVRINASPPERAALLRIGKKERRAYARSIASQ